MSRSSDVISPEYLPFDAETLCECFSSSANAGEQVAYYLSSANAYRDFRAQHPDWRDLPLREVKRPCQIEKDERFWMASTLLQLKHSAAPCSNLITLLTRAFGNRPPSSCGATWDDCVEGNLDYFLEVAMPSPPAYSDWLRHHIHKRTLVPYVRRAATRVPQRRLEGPTHVDAVIVNRSSGFAVFIEAKLVSDISGGVEFDTQRNQLARNIDVMLERQDTPAELAGRLPERTLLVLLTPDLFRQRPQSRLYGWLMREYQQNPTALARDIPHRTDAGWEEVSRRLGWLTWEDFAEVVPGCCSWLGSEAKGD